MIAGQTKNSENLHKLRWHHLPEFIPVLFLVLTPIILATNEKELFDLSLDDWLLWYALALSFVATLGIVTLKVIGPNDFRFKLFIHVVVIGLSTTASGMMLRGTGFFELFNSGSNTSEILLNMSFVLIPLMAIILGAMLSNYALTNPFTEEMEVFATRVKSGELSAQIENSFLLSDSVFGPPIKFINEITDYSGSLLSNAANSSGLIAGSSEQLSSSAEEVNASAEEVSSTSQAMSTGASHQAGMITDIMDQMKDADSIIVDIIKQIQNNTESVSQIALQTNILALNAGIEASRAGDYGRGFMVVAENVRKLSDQSKKSAEQISSVVETISSTLQELFSQIQTGINNVSSVAEETAASAEEVAAAAEEMTSSMEEVSSLALDLSDHAKKSNKVLNSLS